MAYLLKRIEDLQEGEDVVAFGAHVVRWRAVAPGHFMLDGEATYAVVPEPPVPEPGKPGSLDEAFTRGVEFIVEKGIAPTSDRQVWPPVLMQSDLEPTRCHWCGARGVEVHEVKDEVKHEVYLVCATCDPPIPKED